MAKRKSLFDDKAVEIEELTYIIKQVSCCITTWRALHLVTVTAAEARAGPDHPAPLLRHPVPVDRTVRHDSCFPGRLRRGVAASDEQKACDRAELTDR